ncbi:class I adenylate-forming enzyme family protein [Albidovulum sp.]
MRALVASEPPPPCPDGFNLAAHVLREAERLADKTALAVLRPGGAERWSYGRLAGAVRGVATGLLQAGLEPGDRLMMRLDNGVAFPLAFLGAVSAGIVPVPTPAALTAPEVARLVDLVRPAAIVASPGAAVPSPAPCPVLPAADLVAFERLPPAGFRPGAPDRLAYIVFTSGSSGRPRAVAHAHRAIWARRMMREGWTGIGETDRVLHTGALNWTYTLGTGLLDPWAAGATAMVTAPDVAPAQLPLLMRRFDVTIIAGVPGIYRRLLRLDPWPALPRLRHGLSAGEQLPPALRAAWRARTGTDLHEALGMSECSTFISSSPARPAPPGTTGHAQPGRRIAVLDADGRPVARGEPGLLAVAGDDPGLFLGTFGPDGITPPAGDWFVTGDVVVMEEDGAIRYLGRNDDMLNAGGFRLSPAEIEAALLAHPGVAECAAVEVRPRPDTSLIAAFYTGSADRAALAAHAETCLAPYKRPRILERRAALPHNANGKVDRRKLREEWKESP